MSNHSRIKKPVKITDDSHKTYFEKLLGVNNGCLKKEHLVKIEKALEKAHDIRKFEIDMYWKRAAYFWAFIVVIAGAYGFTLFGNSGASIKKISIEVFLCIIGYIFSFSFYCVNRGSKYWQNNWEKHVDILEYYVTGNLYKMPISDRKNSYERYSVSKANQLLSVVICICWCMAAIFSIIVFMSKKVEIINKISYFLGDDYKSSFAVFCSVFLVLQFCITVSLLMMWKIKSSESKNIDVVVGERKITRISEKN